MKLRIKLPALFILIGIVPSIIIALIALIYSSETITKNKFDQLHSVKEVKRSAVNRYLHSIQDQVASMSSNPVVIEGIKDFDVGYRNYATSMQNQNGVIDIKHQLINHYQKEFIPLLKENDPSASISPSASLRNISKNGLFIQHAYIAKNPRKTGEKHLLKTAKNNTEYDKSHEIHHPYFKEYLDRFGYYDIFLINNDGEIIYSVFKDVDFATSLKNGAFANSGLGNAYEKAMSASADSKPTIVDFKEYLPSYNAPAAFMSAPVFDDGQRVGVIAFQFPLDRLNEIMSEREGLGQTGDTYLVGRDSLMRSDSYSDSLNRSVIASFRSPTKGSVKTEGTEAAFNGKDDIKIIKNYNNNPVLSAFGPLGFPGLQWAILAEIDEAEVIKDVSALRLLIFGIIIIMSLAIFVIATLIARSIVRPLGGEPKHMAEIAKRISGGDLTSNIETENTAGLLSSMLVMQRSLKEMTSKISQSATQQSLAAEELTTITAHASKKHNSQSDYIEQIAAAIHEMNASFNEVSQNTKSASIASNETQANLNNSAQQVEDSANKMQGASNKLVNAQQEAQRLKDQANEISQILESIKGIAGKTNLLALNAAIEAARAGEQGRGFAVVADEVRSLAQNTQQSTEEISVMIDALQSGTDSVCNVMDSCAVSMQSVSKNALDTASKLGKTVSSAEEIELMMRHIASASEQQFAVSEDINRQITEISTISNETSAATGQISSATYELAELASGLKRLSSEFKA